jgi:hypothetical protein
MSIKIQRIQSREAGPFSPSERTRAHFDVPASVGFSDLENSHVVFRMKSKIQGDKLLPSFIAQPSISTAGNRDVTQPVSIGGAQALIKNSRSTSDTYGLISEQRDQNVISANLGHYQEYSSCISAKESYDGGIDQNSDANLASRLSEGVFLRPTRPRSTGAANAVASVTDATNPIVKTSELITAEVRCPLKHLDRVADGTRQFPNVVMGDMTYRLEFEDVRPVMSLGPAFSVRCQNIPADAAIPATFGSAANPIQYRWYDENAPAVVTQEVKESALEALPFYVGMPVKLDCDSNAGAIASHYSLIKKITIQTTAGAAPLNQPNVALIELDAPAVVTAAQAITAVVLALDQSNDGAGGAASTVSYEVEDLYLELHTIQLTPQQMQMAEKAMENLQIPYLEHRLVKKVLNQTTDYSETLYLDGGCAGVAVLTPQNNGLVSGYDQSNNYRFSFDGRYVTNRDIQIGPNKSNSGSTTTSGVGRQVHNHMLQKFFGNIGKMLMRFERPRKDYQSPFAAESLQLDNHALYPLVTPMIPNDVIAEFNCRSPANMSTKEVFYVQMYPRSLNIQKGRLVQ